MAAIDTKVTIYSPNDELIWEGYVDDSSRQTKGVMSDNKLFLQFSSDVPVQMPLFAYVDFFGERYFLWEPNNFTKLNTENHAYKLEMDTYIVYLKSQNYEFFTSTQPNDLEITFSLSATPQRFTQLAVDNMNMKDEEGGWSIGECIEADEANLDFDDMTIWDALNMIAEKFSTEWEVEGKVIHMRKVEKLPEHAIPLTYGQGGGILGGGTNKKAGGNGISRSNFSGRVGVLRAKTSNRNIDPSKYGFNSLRMPREFIVDHQDVQYITDKSGSKLRRYNNEHNYPVLPAKTIDLSHIYPKREGLVTEAGTEEMEVDSSEGKVKQDFYYIVDEGIPDNLNYEDYIIEGTVMTIVFQSGSLSGLEFDVKYVHEGRKFYIKFNTDSGITYPNEAMKPGVGDKYIVLNVMLPQEYIDTAERKVLSDMSKYLYENEGDRFTYAFELDPIYAKNNWGSISGYLNIGYFVELREPQYLAEPERIRITEINRYVNRPYSPKITIANNVRGQSVGADIRQVQNLNQTIKRTGKGFSRLTEVRFRDLEELFEQLQNMLHLGFTEGIKPVAINTMMAYFGSDQCQFRWVDNKIDPITEVDMWYEVNDEDATIAFDGGIIQHMTLGIDTMKPGYNANEYKFWDISPLPATYIGDRGFLWVYLKCERPTTGDNTNLNGTFLLSDTDIELESDPNYYHFLCGSLNSSFEGTRNFTTWYGFTSITPGMIRVNKIASPDGLQFWDMLNKAFFLGNANNFLSYNENLDGKLRLKGTIVQSPSGEESVLGAFRGAYSSAKMYYTGDEVTYNGSTYRFINETPSTGKMPPNSTYWTVISQKGTDGYDGADGADGNWIQMVFRMSSTQPSTPTSTSPYPSGWTDSPEDQGTWWMSKATISGYSGRVIGEWSWPILVTGKEGEQGKNGRIFSYAGEYDGSTYYIGNVNVAQVVKYGDIWYYTKDTFGERKGVAPTNSNYWEEYGANFESIATGLLFAEKALISGFNFYNDKIESVQTIAGIPKILLDANTGEITIQSEGLNGSKMNLKDGVLEWYDSNGNLNIRIGTFNSGTFYGWSDVVMYNLPIPTKAQIAQFNDGQVYAEADGSGGYYLKIHNPH